MCYFTVTVAKSVFTPFCMSVNVLKCMPGFITPDLQNIRHLDKAMGKLLNLREFFGSTNHSNCLLTPQED